MMYVKMDIFKIIERRDGAIYRTKKVAYHWFQLGHTPEPNSPVPQDLVQQNGLEPGEYFYCRTMDYVTDVRIPAGGKY